jgi:radical SAM superfamily enzyme YgiQ (UPF0313 family)
MKIGLVNFGGGETTLGLEIIGERLREAGHEVVNFDIANDRNVKDYDILCISIFWWLDKIAYVKFLKEAGINPKNRKPVLVLGGLQMMNPKSLGDSFHYAVIGDGEEVICPLVDAISKGDTEIDIPGVYWPGKASVTKAQSIERLEARQYIDLRNSKQTRIEIARGCKGACRFCLLTFAKPYRELNGEVLRHLIITSKTKNVALFCADRGSHTNYLEIENWCRKYGKRNSATDLRIDSAQKVNVVSNLRFGLEAFTEKTRLRIGKGYKNDTLIEYFRHIFDEVKTPKGGDLTVMTVYMIFGLPGETPDDVKEFSDLMNRVDDICPRKTTIFLSFSSFQPMGHTPFQWAPMDIYAEWDKAFEKLWHKTKNIVIAKRGGFIPPARQLVQMACERGDERAFPFLYFIATTPGIENVLRNRAIGHKSIGRLLKSAGIDMDELTGEIQTDLVMACDCVETYYGREKLVKSWQSYQKK